MYSTCTNPSMPSAKYGPRSRSMAQPSGAAITAAAAVPARTANGQGQDSLETRIATAYAPIPKNEIWPKETYAVYSEIKVHPYAIPTNNKVVKSRPIRYSEPTNGTAIVNRSAAAATARIRGVAIITRSFVRRVPAGA